MGPRVGSVSLADPFEAVEDGGYLWRPLPGAVADRQAFLAARTFRRKTRLEARWSPWLRDDRADELNEAAGIVDQWTRFEPGYRLLTELECVEDRARWERAVDFASAERMQRAKRYDEAREMARLALIEQQAWLRIHQDRLDGLKGSIADRQDVEARRAVEVGYYEDAIQAGRRQVEGLAPLVGDPETVVDRYGCTPSDRRSLAWSDLVHRRHAEVCRLRTVLRRLELALETSTSRRATLAASAALTVATEGLEQIILAPPLEPADMCSECEQAMTWHLRPRPGNPDDGPCPGWPRWREHFIDAIESLSVVAQPPPPEERALPLATMPAGLPVAEVIARLSELETRFPGSRVDRGKKGRIEIWPVVGDPLS